MGRGLFFTPRRSLAAPVEARTDSLLEGRSNLTRVSVPAELSFAEDQIAVERHLEVALRTTAQLDAAHDRRPTGEKLFHQAHGPVQIVSGDAVFDHRVMLWIDHLQPLPRNVRWYSELSPHRPAAEQQYHCGGKRKVDEERDRPSVRAQR